MNPVAWLLFGLIVGIVANSFDSDPNGNGIVANIALGVGGAFAGGFLANLLFGSGVTGFDLTAFLIAISGSLMLIFIGRSVRHI